jgi:hypothetical protein
MVDLEVVGTGPESMRTQTNESARSKMVVKGERKWWRPPSSWEVDREGAETTQVVRT